VDTALSAGWYWLAFAASAVDNDAAPAVVTGIQASYGSEISYNLGIGGGELARILSNNPASGNESTAIEADSVNPTSPLPDPFPDEAYVVTMQTDNPELNAVALAISVI
jgi:hypothetical protein